MQTCPVCGMGSATEDCDHERTGDRPLVTDGGQQRPNQGNQQQHQQGGQAQGGPQQGGQRGGQPQGGYQQGGQPQGGYQQGGQPQGNQAPRGQPQGGQPPGGQPPGDGGSGGLPGGDGGLSRRNLLIGGAGVVAVAGGGWFFFLRGPSGAEGVAANVVNAIADNDWAAIEDQFHEEAPVKQTIDDNDNVDDYEEYLEQRGQLEDAEDLEPSVEQIVEWRHVPEIDDEDAASILGVDPDLEDDLEEGKQLIVITEAEIDTVYEDADGADSLSGDTTRTSMSMTVVNDADAGWRLYRTSI